jgi:hypothetical protein
MTSAYNPPQRQELAAARRIERELAVLRTMEGHLFSRELLWAVLTLPGVAALVILVPLKTHWLSGSPVLAATVAALTGLGVWWIGQRWISLAVGLVFGLVLILLEDLPDIGDIGGGSAKEKRRLKLERAIARREAILAQLDGRQP